MIFLNIALTMSLALFMLIPLGFGLALASDLCEGRHFKSAAFVFLFTVVFVGSAYAGAMVTV
jgi:hypothetical protein